MQFEWSPKIEKETRWSKEEFISHMGEDDPVELPLPPWGTPEYADRSLYLHGMIGLAELCRTHRGLLNEIHVGEETLGESKDDEMVFLAMLRILVNGTYHLYLRGERFLELQSAIAALFPHNTCEKTRLSQDRDYDLYVTNYANKNVNGKGFYLEILASGSPDPLDRKIHEPCGKEHIQIKARERMQMNASYCTNFKFIVLDSRPYGVSKPYIEELKKLAKEFKVQKHAFFSGYVNTPMEVL